MKPVPPPKILNAFVDHGTVYRALSNYNDDMDRREVDHGLFADGAVASEQVRHAHTGKVEEVSAMVVHYGDKFYLLGEEIRIDLPKDTKKRLLTERLKSQFTAEELATLGIKV